MKAITIKQPWASLIVHGIKDIENRTWPCPKKYLGQSEIICGNGYVNSAIIGSVEIVDCVVDYSSIWAEKGVYNWVLANPILYSKPIENVKGKLSFWDYSGIKEVKIECPECGSIEIAVEDYTTAPFPTYLHRCNKCDYVIMESEWNVIK